MTNQSRAIGLLLPSREARLWGDSGLTLIGRAGRRADQAGYDRVWAGHSLLARPRAEPLSLLSAVAGATTRVSLGTAVLLPLLRHPVSLAHALSTLDRLSRGRVIVGIGPGAELPGTHAELAAIGVPSDRRISAMLETIGRCRRLWRGEEAGMDPEPKPSHSGGPPIWPAGNGPRMRRWTGTEFDGWLPRSPTPGGYATGLRAVQEAAERAGRDPGSMAAGGYLTLAT